MATRGQLGGPLTGSTGAITSVAFSPDGGTLAAVGSTNGLGGIGQLFNVTTGRQAGPSMAAGDVDLGAAFSRTARPWPPAASMA